MMRKYKLLKNSDIIADNNYLAITFNHSYASDKDKYTRAELTFGAGKNERLTTSSFISTSAQN